MLSLTTLACLAHPAFGSNLPHAPLGAVPICFDNGQCYDLTTYLSSDESRSELKNSCDDKNTAFNRSCSTWDQFVYVNSTWGWEKNITPAGDLSYKMQSIPGINDSFAEDMQALCIQPFKADHGSWLPEALGANASGILPESFRDALLLSASGTNRLRDLPASEKSLLWYDHGNEAPTSQNIDSDFPDALIQFHGAQWFQPFCSAVFQQQQADFVNTAITSNALRMPHAATYSGEEGTMWVWLAQTSGNQPFTGEWEFLVNPGARMRQLACDVYPPPGKPYSIIGSYGQNCSVRSVSFAYETTRNGVLTAAGESRLLHRLRDSFYNWTGAER
jgi:hypothetical protein